MDCKGGFQMIRLFSVFLGMLLLMGCSPQPEYGFTASFRNVCNVPVRVTALNYNNKREPLDLDVQVNPGDVVIILNIVGFRNDPEDPDNGISSDYELELSVNGRLRNFDRETFLDMLNKSSHKSDAGGHAWFIRDPSLCP
jgi:hypothetical protein